MVLGYFASYVYGSGSGSRPDPSVAGRHNSVRRPARGARNRSSNNNNSSSSSSAGSSSAAASGASARRGNSRNRHRAGQPTTVDEQDELYEDDGLDGADRRPGVQTDPQLALIDYINTVGSLYDVVGISPTFRNNDELRRAYMGRCRVCHPDKFPHYSDDATRAFQRVSLAYETLSKPATRRAYDLSGHHDDPTRNSFPGADASASSSSTGYYGGTGLHTDLGDETLRSVLYTMYCDFLDKGDFEMVRVLVEALNASNPGLNLGEEAIDGIEAALRRLRGVLLAGAKHFRIVKFELIRLYEIQHDLRQLSYFDVFGRLRLSLQLARVTLSIPMAIDKAMREEAENDEAAANGEGGYGDGINGYVEEGDPLTEEDTRGQQAAQQVARRGLLGPRVASVLNLAVAVLEKGERII